MTGAPWTVVLAGGVGSRFWPLSTPARPKQLLPLLSPQSMLRDTIDRLAAVSPLAQTLVLTNASLVDAIRRELPDLPGANVIAEPRPAGTAAALTWGALEVARRADPGAVMLSVHADWAIGDVPAFQRALLAAAAAAERENALVTVGMVPVRPDPGLGYIEPGDVVEGSLRRVRRFIEKPSRDRAAELVRLGCLWNSGIFAWRAGDLLEEVTAHCPEVAPAAAAHGASREEFFAAARAVAIDVGVLERSRRVMVLPGDFGWSDVGTWTALRDVRVRDADGNAPHGAVLAREAHGNVVHAEGTTVVLYGVDDLVVVSANGLTLVTTLERATDLKTLLDTLPSQVRDR
ncbi:MAG: mannose-1-phosphate guanylyltransferase [Gemmatimonadetes bacterium]|nr:mannose-1-phosphate guanylyltransferase [Gemmatimonadota bacterium]